MKHVHLTEESWELLTACHHLGRSAPLSGQKSPTLHMNTAHSSRSQRGAVYTQKHVCNLYGSQYHYVDNRTCRVPESSLDFSVTLSWKYRIQHKHWNSFFLIQHCKHINFINYRKHTVWNCTNDEEPVVPEQHCCKGWILDDTLSSTGILIRV